MGNLKNITALLLVMLKISFKCRASNKTSTCFNTMDFIRGLVDVKKYDKSMRPCENGEPVVVRVGMYIVSINKIEESDMELDIQIYFRQTWRDHRLSFSGLNITSEQDYIQLPPGSILDRIWRPDAYFENEKRGKFHHIMRENEFVRLYPNGNIFFSSRLTLTLSCAMEFYDFPMDTQVCTIKFLSYGYSTKNLVYTWFSNKTETSVYSNKLNLPQFDIVKTEIGSYDEVYTVGNFSILTLDIYFHRRIAFYMTHNYIPAVLVVGISWLSFWLDRGCAPARVGMGITTILTMTTLLIGIGQQKLPVVSYIKALDWYYIGCFVFVFAALCEYTIVNYLDVIHKRHVLAERLRSKISRLEKAKREAKSKRLREKYDSGFGMDLRGVESSTNKEESVDENSQELSLHCHLSDVIDNTVRIIYPLLFLVFNIVYWVTYQSSYAGKY